MQEEIIPTFRAGAADQAVSPPALIGLDLENKVQFWSPPAAQLFGWSESEVKGHPLPMLDNAGFRIFENALESQLRSGQAHELMCRWSRKTQAPVDVRVGFSCWSGPDARCKGIFLTVAELSEQRPADPEDAQLIQIAHEEQEQTSAASRYRELLEAAPDAIVKVDQTGRIVLMNRATESLFGYARRELVGQPVEMLVPRAARLIRVAARRGYRHYPEGKPMGRGLAAHAVRKDGSKFPAEISLSPVHAGNEVRVIAVVRDVTERKRIEEQMRSMEQRFSDELAAKNRELELRNQKIEEANQLKSEFLASMSHELRTPLHTIIGFSELLAEEIQGTLNPRQRRFVDHIHRDSRHLLELINDILDLSKIESGKVELRPEIFAARPVIEEVVESVRPAAESKSIRIGTQIDQEHVLEADQIRFKQVLYNLLSNAVKFTPSGGRVTAGTAESDPGFCRFIVEDTGIGIPEGQTEAIFDKFHQVGSTTSGIREGTGLGLTITRHIVELHGGFIRVESQPGQGSSFSFTMPSGENK